MRQDFYKSKAWERNRVAYALSKNCICEKCGRPVYVAGITDYVPKENRLKYIVHHKVFLNEDNYTDDNIALNWDNLELLCLDCHSSVHFSHAPVRNGLEFDENGNLVPKITIKRNL